MKESIQFHVGVICLFYVFWVLCDRISLIAETMHAHTCHSALLYCCLPEKQKNSFGF